MVDIHKIRIEVQMLVAAHLDRGIGRLVGGSAGWERHLSKKTIGGNVDFGEGLGAEFCRVDV